MAERLSEILDPKKYGYAVGQGTLAIVCRESDAASLALIKPMHHDGTQMSSLAERGMLRTLQGGCKVPISVRTEFSNRTADSVIMSVWGAVLSLDGTQMIEHTESVSVTKDNLEKVSLECGQKLGNKLLSLGANEILAGIPRD